MSSRSHRPTSAARPGPATTLAATLIVRDEARCIVRCLESVRPWVDRIIVLDTGSVDDTVLLARQCGAEVHHRDWPDDFSVARNHLLDLSDADWNLMIDADEWIVSGGEVLRDWCAGAPRLGAACVHSQFDLPQSPATGDAAPVTRGWITRLLPRGVRYQGRVHEQPVSPLPLERLDLHIGHDGYLDAQADRKRDRNGPLLMRELADNPEDPYTLYQLGKDAESRQNYAAASQWYGQAFARAPEKANWLHSLLVRHLHCLGQTGAVTEALDLAEQQMEAWQFSPDFFFVLGNLVLDRAMTDPANALGHWLPLAQSAWERCLDIGERPDLEGSVQGRGSHLAQHNLDVMRSQMAMQGG
ncbi:glycosyltransferase family 2 protein [Sphingobium sufflavum]|uniref:glycosyltransferase n=1 Tax=Sphingobium sufflavum TaxID=1129547 RepID=UPI001F47A4C4|nr:glycosyltransferase family 2 protein [Sphingobium sufflavum]MCE7795940.1 glycosyltransferase family 2 protein [Sphingobium sufflavum]